jgi:hypothetical protein
VACLEAQGFNPISAKIIVRRFDRRMASVPEGQADSSQARSTWVAMQRGPRPGGTVEVIVSPTDICRRN